MTDIRNFTKINGGKDNQTEFAKAVEELAENMDATLEYMRVRSEIKRSYYTHLIEQGFTEDQALDIIKSDSSF